MKLSNLDSGGQAISGRVGTDRLIVPLPPVVVWVFLTGVANNM